MLRGSSNRLPTFTLALFLFATSLLQSAAVNLASAPRLRQEYLGPRAVAQWSSWAGMARPVWPRAGRSCCRGRRAGLVGRRDWRFQSSPEISVLNGRFAWCLRFSTVWLTADRDGCPPLGTQSGEQTLDLTLSRSLPDWTASHARASAKLGKSRLRPNPPVRSPALCGILFRQRGGQGRLGHDHSSPRYDHHLTPPFAGLPAISGASRTICDATCTSVASTATSYSP